MSLVVLCKCDEIWKPGSIPKEELGKKIKLIFNLLRGLRGKIREKRQPKFSCISPSQENGKVPRGDPICYHIKYQYILYN